MSMFINERARTPPQPLLLSRTPAWESHTIIMKREYNGGDNFGIESSSSSVERVKKEEVNSKINAWQNSNIAKVNNRFKRQESIITAWETEKIHKANSCMKKLERKLEEKRVRALENMQNDIAKAHRKAEESKASAEAKRGIKVAEILQRANFMKAMGIEKPPVKRSFFSD